jgi:beta-lactamase superfamily II metal-dependent hydrolase
LLLALCSGDLPRFTERSSAARRRGEAAESAVLDENREAALRADVLKIGYRGSKNATMAGFLAAVQPRRAVISAAEDNPYGHRNPELLERLSAGATTRST